MTWNHCHVSHVSKGFVSLESPNMSSCQLHDWIFYLRIRRRTGKTVDSFLAQFMYKKVYSSTAADEQEKHVIFDVLKAHVDSMLNDDRDLDVTQNTLS